MAFINEDQGRYKTFSRRAALIAGGQVALFAALAGRMYQLQVLDSDRYAMLAEDNRISLRLIPPPRGRIFDRFGVPLAVNQHQYRLVLISENSPDVEATLDRIGQIVQVSPKERERILREVRRKRGFVPITVRDNLSWDQVSRIEVNAPDLPGTAIEVGETRHYPYGESMSHILGYVAAVSEEDLTGDPLLELPGFRIGKSGVERRYDLDLRGSAGTSHVEVNAVGRTIRELNREEGTPGSEARLTIDAELQEYVFQRLQEKRSATAVVLDANTGAVLSLVSSPGYDPNAFARGISTGEWHDLISDPLSPLTNKAIAGTYNPGSTYKMMVALAAMESGIQPSHKVYCPGYMELGNARFHCWKRWGHGRMDMHDAIKQSCDVYFYDLARKISIDKLAEVSRRFGLGDPVGIDLPGELGGRIPTRQWKLAYIGEPWQKGETLVSAIGQGFVLSTPLQLAVMTARIASGKAVVPYLLQDAAGAPAEREPEVQAASAGETDEGAEPGPDAAQQGKLNVPERHLQVVRQAMDAVVNEQRGTAYYKRITEEGWEMAGKTGTSQVRRITMAERKAGVIKNEDLPWRRRDHGLFVGFAPVHAPRYVVAVVVEHGGGGSSAAAPIARDILMEAQRRDPLKRSADRRVAHPGPGDRAPVSADGEDA
ncbi:MAG: penicillin-binding protein 2 [Rhodovibrionaceae bacterium]|nr:penicillin-binding protein 2 [Rhodovibrionaceae bacterium]